MTPISRRTILFSLQAETNRNAFKKQYGVLAEECLEGLERDTRLEPEDGSLIPETLGCRVAIRYVNTDAGVFICQAVYVFNDDRVKWLKFAHKFLPAADRL